MQMLRRCNISPGVKIIDDGAVREALLCALLVDAYGFDVCCCGAESAGRVSALVAAREEAQVRDTDSGGIVVQAELLCDRCEGIERFSSVGTARTVTWCGAQARREWRALR
jgi:hypothetical protein